MLQLFPTRITIVLLITTNILVAEIEFAERRNGKTVPVGSLNNQQNSMLLQNRNAASKFITNVNGKSEKTFPSDNSKLDLLKSVFLRGNFPTNAKLYPNTNVISGAEKRKFSFLLDSDDSRPMVNKNIAETTKVQHSTTPDLITNTDIKVLQKFVKKLKSSVKTEEKALPIPIQETSKLASSIGPNNELRKPSNTHSAGNPYQQPNLQKSYDNREQYSSNQDEIPLNTQNNISPKDKKVSLQQTNNLNNMSKSDVDALLAVAKEWKRLHSEENENQPHDHELKISNEKNNMQGIVNKQSRERAYSTPKSQRERKLFYPKQNYMKYKQPFNAGNERGRKIKVNRISKLARAKDATKLTNENTISNDAGLQLKETVDKAIANTTQQLLQFIKLEKHLKGLQNGSFLNESKNDIHYTNTFINLINTMRNSKNLGGGERETKHNNFKEKEENDFNSAKQIRLEKQTSLNQKEHSSFSQNGKDSQEFKTVQKKIAKERKLKQRLKAKSQDQMSHKLKQKQQIRKQKELGQSQTQQNKNEEQRKKVKTQRKIGQKEKYKSHKQENDLKHAEENHEHKQQKQEQQKQTQHRHEEEQQQQQQQQHQREQEQQEKHQKQQQQQHEEREQEKQEQQKQQQQGDQETEKESGKNSENNRQTNVKNEYNIQAGQQEEIKEQEFQSPNTSTTDEQREDDVLKTARHFRMKTMKHLIASLAEDPFDTWIYHQKSFDELGITPSLLKAGIVNLGSSKPMQNAVRKAVRGENVKLLVVGGSISAGGGLWKDRGNIDGVYHRALAYWWKKTVTPVTNSEMEVNNVAIGGTDSEYFSYCINNFLDSDPDIVFWELSANDYNRFNERNFDPSKPLEQLTRIILQLPSHPALIYVNFFRGDKQNFELGEKCPDSEETEVDVLSRYYDIPSLSWRRMVCNLITKRTFVTQELFGDDGYHPNLLGHAQVAMLLMMYIKGIFESVLADDLGNMKKFNILDENDVDFQDDFQLKIPAFKDPLNPKPSCWTLLTPDYTKLFRNTLNEVNVLKGEGFELRNVTAWDVRTDRIQCLFATKPGAILDLSLNVPVLDYDKNLPLADAQTRTLAIAIHNKFGGAADVQLDELPSKASVATGTGKLKQTRVHIVSEDVRPGVHNLRFRSLSPGFCLTSIMVI